MRKYPAKLIMKLFFVSIIICSRTMATTCEDFNNHIETAIQNIQKLKEYIELANSVTFLEWIDNIEDEIIDPLQDMVNSLRDKQCGKKNDECCETIKVQLKNLIVNFETLHSDVNNSNWSELEISDANESINDLVKDLDKINTSISINNFNRNGIRFGCAYFPGNIMHWVDGEKVQSDFTDAQGVAHSSSHIFSPEILFVWRIWRYGAIGIGASVLHGNEEISITDDFPDMATGSSENYKLNYLFPSIIISPGALYRWSPLKVNVHGEIRLVSEFLSNEHRISRGEVTNVEKVKESGSLFISYGFSAGLELLLSKHFGLGLNFSGRTFWNSEPDFEWYDDYYKLVHRRVSQKYVLHPYQTVHEFKFPPFGITGNFTCYF